jgi:hypothetical protein
MNLVAPVECRLGSCARKNFSKISRDSGSTLLIADLIRISSPAFARDVDPAAVRRIFDRVQHHGECLHQPL